MVRLSLILGIAVLGLTACRDDLDDRGTTPTPTPIPLVTPTPVPSSNEDTGDDSDGSSSGGGIVSGSGAIMAAPNERVGVVSIDSSLVVNSILTIERGNGEVWEFELNGIPRFAIGATLIYRNRNLVFGSIDGVIIFSNGVTMSLVSSVRIQ